MPDNADFVFHKYKLHGFGDTDFDEDDWAGYESDFDPDALNGSDADPDDDMEFSLDDDDDDDYGGSYGWT